MTYRVFALKKTRLEKQYIDPGVCVCMSLKEKSPVWIQEKPRENGSYYGCCLVANSIAIHNSLSHCKFCTLNLFNSLKHPCDERKKKICIEKVLNNFSTTLFSTLQ